jgi:hypothetical protein
MPAYRFYRFYGNESGSCTVNEVHLFGVEVIQDENSSYECTPIIHQGIDYASLELINSVTY